MKPCIILPALVLALAPFPSLAQKRVSEKTVDSIYQVALFLREQGDYPNAIIEANKALELAKKSGYKKIEGNSYMQIGRSLKEQGRPREALTYYEKVLKIRQDLKDSSGVASVYNNMSSACELLEKYPQGLECSRLAIDIWQRLPNQDTNLAKAYNNKANIFGSAGEQDSAVFYNRKSIALFPVTQDTLTLAVAEQGLGKRFLDKEQLDSAYFYFDRAFVKYQALKDTLGLAMIQEGRALVDMRAGEFEKAKEQFVQAEQLYRIIGDTAKLGNLYENLGIVYENMGEYGEARSSYEAAAFFKYGKPGVDTLDRIRVTGVERLSFLQARSYGVDLRADLDQTHRYLVLALSIGLVLACCLAVAMYLLLNAHRKMSKLKHDVVKSSLHAINNNLLSSQEKFRQDEPGYALIFKIRGMVNRLLTRIGFPPEKTFEIATLKPFAREMHQVAMETTLMMVENHSYLEEVDDYPLDKNLRENLEAIVLEAFTNIHKYAQCTKCSIGFFLDEEGLRLEIEDDGVGFDPNKTRDGGQGLRNIRDRAKEINARCQIISSPDKGTKIKITVRSFLQE